MSKADEKYPMHDQIWEARKLVGNIEYWLVGFSFPIAVLAGVFYSPWLGVAIWFGSTLYAISANFRGLLLYFLEERKNA